MGGGPGVERRSSGEVRAVAHAARPDPESGGPLEADMVRTRHIAETSVPEVLREGDRIGLTDRRARLALPHQDRLPELRGIRRGGRARVSKSATAIARPIRPPGALARSRPQVPRERAAAVFLQRRSRDPAGSPWSRFSKASTRRGWGPVGAGEAVLRSSGPPITAASRDPAPLPSWRPDALPPRWLAPPVIAFEYFRSLRFSQRASWFVFVALASLWIFRPRSAQVSPAPIVRSS